MKIFNDRLLPRHGYLEGKADAVDAATAELAASYKKNVLKHYIPVSRQQIDRRFDRGRWFVTRKYDGEYAILFYERGEAVTLNRSGRVRAQIPCIELAARLLRDAGVKQAVIPCEIYIPSGQRPGRLNDLLSALADRRRIGQLRLAAFDLLQLDGQTWHPASYRQTWEQLNAWFGGGESVHPVEMVEATTPQRIAELYDRWVAGEGAEGLVVQTDTPFTYKIKPRHAIDAVVVGFSEGTGSEKGLVRSLLTALMPEPDSYQIVGRVGSGLGRELQRQLFDELSLQIVPSEYIATDSNRVAFRMVRPEKVVELSVGDLLFETESGAKTNVVLRFGEKGYRIASETEGFKYIAPVFERIREDKRPDPADVRLEQVESFTAFDPTQMRTQPAPEKLPASRLLLREVYIKTLGHKTMVQKFMVWKTNKEQSGDYPAYVLYHADLSTSRAVPLQRRIAVSSSERQIRTLLSEAMRRHLKSGWVRVPQTASDSGEPDLNPHPEQEPVPTTPRRSGRKTTDGKHTDGKEETKSKRATKKKKTVPA